MACLCSLSFINNSLCPDANQENIFELSKHDKRLLNLRFKTTFTTSCKYHYKYFVNEYTHNFGAKCADPDYKHRRKCKGSHIISEEMHSANNQLIPGQTLCINCYPRYAVPDKININNSTVHSPQSVSSGSLYEEPTDIVKSIQKMLEACEVDKIDEAKFSKQSNDRKLSLALSKINEVTEVLITKFSRLLNVSKSALNSNEFDKLLPRLSEKYKSSGKEKKVQILSLIPESFSYNYIQHNFGATKNEIIIAKKLRESLGILPDLSAVSRVKLDPEIKLKVCEFYTDSQYTAPMPGMRDYVCVRNTNNEKQQLQKLLLQYTLKELYQLFKNDNPDLKIGFSKFAELRPKQCVLGNDKNTWNCCVCIYCQNLKLILEPLGKNLKIDTILSEIVCYLSSEVCMFSQCRSCKGIDDIEEICENLLNNNDCVSVRYKQWTTDASLSDNQVSRSEYIGNVSRALIDIKEHYFLNLQQKSYYQSSKSNLQQHECVMVVDFGSNYSLQLQDSIQAYFFQTPSVTLHPFVIYYLDKLGKQQCQSFCAISDCTEHNTASFYAFQCAMIEKMKTMYPWITYIKYFSDGCAAQYKNRKNFANVLCHTDDFGLDCEWNFCVSCHGKGVCDSCAGSIKRKFRHASMRSVPIRNATEMFEYCQKEQENIKTITFFVSAKEVAKIERSKLNRRFKYLETIPNTRKIHFLKKHDNKSIVHKMYSSSPNSHITKMF